jgi:hypothetical protein
MAFLSNKKVPVDQVRGMKSQGYTNTQIIETLQRDGYSYADIIGALDQMDQQTGAPFANAMPKMDMPAPMSIPQPQQQSAGSYDVGSSEELIEAIIDEKWNELVKDINKIIDWKNKTENKITAMEQKFNDLKENFDKLHEAVIGKIGEYDKNILEVGSEIKAMEKVFSKVLPVFTENVNELSRITSKVKGKRK